MSSTLIPRIAVASSRSTLAVVTARRHLHHNPLSGHLRRHPGHLQQQQQQQLQRSDSRGLTHRSSVGGTTPKDQLQNPAQPQNHKHPELHQKDHHHHAHHQQQTRRPSTSQAAQRAVIASPDDPQSLGEDVDPDVLHIKTASGRVFRITAGEHEWWAPEPERRLQLAVQRFGQKYFLDELPCRTRKMVADAAAAGKDHVTAEDIIRVLETISDGKHIASEEEVHHICKAWGTRRSAGEGGGGHAAATTDVDHADEDDVVSGSGSGGGLKSGTQTGKAHQSPGEGSSAPVPTIPKEAFLKLLVPTKAIYDH